MEKNLKLLGVGITNYSLEEILEYFFKILEGRQKKIFLTTINSEILVASYKDSNYKSILNSSDLAIIDGFWTQKAARFLGFDPVYRNAGVELVEILCREASKRPITVGFFGGRGNVADRASNCLKSKYPGLKVAFSVEEWTEFEARGISPKCDILFVALGHGKQEKWISENLSKIDVYAAMGVGGALDYLSGKVKRAPKWIQNIGFEWLFRLIRQPWRIKRQSLLIYFVLLIVKEKLTGKKIEK